MESSLTLGKRIKERTLDIMDWVDFRPDPDYWPLLALPVLALSAAAAVNVVGTILIFVVALAASLFALLMFALVCAAWIVGRSLADVTLLGIDRQKKAQVRKPARPLRDAITA